MKENFENYTLFDLLSNPHEELREGFLADCPNDPELFSSIRFGDRKFSDEVSKYLNKAKLTTITNDAPRKYTYSPIERLIPNNNDFNYSFSIRSRTRPKNIFSSTSKIATTHFYSSPELNYGLSLYISQIDYADYSEYMAAKNECLKGGNIPKYPFNEKTIDEEGIFCRGKYIYFHLLFVYKSGKDGYVGLFKGDCWSIISVYRIIPFWYDD